MRAQLRTYHSIPSLQAHQDPNSYKQLQDAPRLKSILKGATEDIEQPSTLDDIKAHPIPRTNPVNLIFVLAQFAPKISELHFDVPRDFFDLVMKSCLSSQSRATAFLWLMWWYLESDFTEHDALNSPYGAGRYGAKGRDDEALESLPLKCPAFEVLTDAQAEEENVDTEAEKEFGETKRLERLTILATDMAPVVTGSKRVSRKGIGYPSINPVFSVASDDGGTGSPAQDYRSPGPSGTGMWYCHPMVLQY
jgi:Ino eighty subunit 1